MPGVRQILVYSLVFSALASGTSASPPFKFLGQNKPVAYSAKMKSDFAILGVTDQTYSFRTNYLRLVERAKHELLPLGWTYERISKDSVFFHFGKSKAERAHNLIGIHRNRRSIPNGEQGYLVSQGWVVVSIYRPLNK